MAEVAESAPIESQAKHVVYCGGLSFSPALVTQFECPSTWTHPDHISRSSLHITSRGMILLYFRLGTDMALALWMGSVLGGCGG